MTLAAEIPGRSTSPLTRMDPRWRMVGLFGWTVGVSLLNTIAVSMVALVGSIALFHMSALPGSWLARRLIALLPILALLVLPLLVLQGSSATAPALLLITKSLAIALPTFILIGLSASSETWDALRLLGVPSRIVSLLMLSERSGTMLAGAFNRTRRAICVRGFRWNTSLRTYQTVGTAISSMALRGIRQSHHMENALACRGFDGRHRCWRTYQTHWIDVAFTTGCLIAITGLVACDWWSVR